MRPVANLVVGKADVDPALPSHVPGVRQGNWPDRKRRRKRARGKDPALDGDAHRSTGVSAGSREPIDPRMPKLTPP